MTTLRPVVLALAVLGVSGCASTAAQRSPVGAGGVAEAPLAAPEASELHVATAAEGVARGDASLSVGKAEEALYYYLQAAQLDTGAVAPLLRVAAIQESRRNVPMAIRAYELALARDPTSSDATERLGLLLVQINEDGRAGKLMEETLQRDPSRWRVHDALGLLADRRGDRAAALEHFDAALALVPNSPTVLNNRGYSRLRAGDLRGAEADFRRSLQNASVVQARLNLATAIARQGRYEEALDVVSRGLPEHEALYRVGEVALANGDLRAAREFLERAARASPTYYEDAYRALQTANRPVEHRTTAAD